MEVVRIIESEVSSGRLLNYVEGVSRFHRVQASAGHREAAHYIQQTLEQNGVSARVLSYPADYGLSYLGRKSFPEWNCQDAELRLVTPEHKILASFTANATSVIQRSGACDYRQTPLEIVYLDQGSKEENYEGLDLKGKLIFVRDNHLAYVDWAIAGRGALGIITDWVLESRNARTRHDQYDANRYAAFWYYDQPDSMPFGYSLTPRQGDELAKLCLKMRAANGQDPDQDRYPKATCWVDAQVVPGFVEVVEAEIPGESDEEILVTAHSCHPRHSANDNASGVAAAMEALGALSNLIRQGRLAPLQRTLRVILMPEFTGTLPYLSDHRHGKTLAGINMDMVGGKQSLGYGPLTVVGLPYSTPSFVADLAGIILDELGKEADSHTPDTKLPMFNYKKINYSGGSDHLILSDPVIGIPSPMLLQWPDIFYHTGGDTLDKICPHLIAKSTSLTASYAYTLCNLSLEDVQPILFEALRSFTATCIEAITCFSAAELSPLSPDKALSIVGEYYAKAAEEFRRYLPQSPKLQHLLDSHLAMLKGMETAFRHSYGVEPCAPKAREYPQIPVRLSEAVVFSISDNAISEEQKAALKEYSDNWATKHGHGTVAHYLMQYLIDGRRSIDEIADIVIFQCRGGSREAVAKYIHLYRELGYCEF
ncbi:MAG: DUF4910 domain-containing protein [Symbiobacteriaceae bacterium]|nr:DUF4910 domain-containing protein [Symbiobacteriaceae bacterium]